MPWAGALYACDFLWWDRNRDLWEGFGGYRFSWSPEAVRAFNLRHVYGRKAPGLGIDCVHTGAGSGYMAIGVAFHMGASEIYLLGYDMQMDGDKIHWHGHHKKTSNPTERMLRKWAECYPPLHKDLDEYGVPLVNLSRNTALEIPRAALEDVLCYKRGL